MFLVDDLHPIKIRTVVNPRMGLPVDELVFRGFYVTTLRSAANCAEAPRPRSAFVLPYTRT